MTCRSCARAVHGPLVRDYRKDCTGCGVRELAHMPAEEREKQLLKLQHLCGEKAVKRVREDVRVEMARIKAMRLELDVHTVENRRAREVLGTTAAGSNHSTKGPSHG